MSLWQKYPSSYLLAKEMSDKKTVQEISDELTNVFGEKFTYDSVRNKLRRGNGDKEQKAILKGPGETTIVTGETTIVISCVHIPFELNSLNSIISSWYGKADRLVVAGDFLDVYCVSYYTKDKDIQLLYELKLGYGYLSDWVKNFKEVILVPGNHEERICTYVAKNVDMKIHFLVESDILYQFKKGFQGYPPLDLKVEYDWWTQVGDCIIAHPYDYSKVQLKTVTNTDDYFLSMGKDHRAVIIGHTHKAGSYLRDGRRLLMECGCLRKSADEIFKAKVNKKRPQVKAYAVLVQDKGVTDFNKTRIVYLDEQEGEKNEAKYKIA